MATQTPVHGYKQTLLGRRSDLNADDQRIPPPSLHLSYFCIMPCCFSCELYKAAEQVGGLAQSIQRIEGAACVYISAEMREKHHLYRLFSQESSDIATHEPHLYSCAPRDDWALGSRWRSRAASLTKLREGFKRNSPNQKWNPYRYVRWSFAVRKTFPELRPQNSLAEIA